jgi:hypothetical protein
MDAGSGITAADGVSFADQAVAALRAAIELGWKQTSELQGQEFAALRDRADFRELVVGLQRK